MYFCYCSYFYLFMYLFILYFFETSPPDRTSFVDLSSHITAAAKDKENGRETERLRDETSWYTSNNDPEVFQAWLDSDFFNLI